MTVTLKSVAAALTLLALTEMPRPAAAQSSLPLGGYLTANFGVAQPNGSLESVASDTFGVNTNTVTTSFAGGHAPLVDVGGGLLLQNRLFVGAAFEHSSTTTPATLAVSLDHPDFHPTLLASTDTDPLERSDDALHLQTGYRVPLGRQLSVLVFGGPSYYSTSRDLVSDLGVVETFNPVTRTFSATITPSDTEHTYTHASAWGYNVGADASWFFSRFVGLGGTVRYGHAVVDLENPLQSLVEDRRVTDPTDVGGLRIGAGIRLRF